MNLVLVLYRKSFLFKESEIFILFNEFAATNYTNNVVTSALFTALALIPLHELCSVRRSLVPPDKEKELLLLNPPQT